MPKKWCGFSSTLINMCPIWRKKSVFGTRKKTFEKYAFLG